MTLVKVGSTIINMDLVVDIELGDDLVIVTFALEEGRRAATDAETAMPYYTRRFRGEEATALRRWLEAQAVDVLPPPSYGVY